MSTTTPLPRWFPFRDAAAEEHSNGEWRPLQLLQSATRVRQEIEYEVRDDPQSDGASEHRATSPFSRTSHF